MKNRPERIIFFLVVWLTMFSCLNGWGQKSAAGGPEMDFLQLKYPGKAGDKLGLKSPVSSQNEGIPRPLKPFFSQDLNSGLNRHGSTPVTAGKAVIYTQPADFYYIQSGFFCRREWELEKTTHIPLRFRLGSLADCNALEGKR
jgi:hypothetical protein